MDYEAKQYIGIHLKWDYLKREVICSMDGYVAKALEELEHIFPKKHYYGPSNTMPPTYGAKVQYVQEDLTQPLTPEQYKSVERIVGKFLYYARAIDNTMAHMMNHLGSQKSKGTQKLMQAVTHFLNYAASNPSAKIIYRKSDMLYKVDSDAAYLVCPQARSRAGGYHYLGNKDNNLFNGPIYILATIIKNVMASAAEAEVAGLFINANKAVPIRHTLIEMGHPQPPTPLKTDNTTAQGILTGKFRQKRSKSIDMRFWWLKDRIDQQQFKAIWGPGKENLADYTTKFHIPAHHKKMRPIQLYIKDRSPSTLKGCIKIMNPENTVQTAPRLANTKTARAALSHRIYRTQNLARVKKILLTPTRILTL